MLQILCYEWPFLASIIAYLHFSLHFRETLLYLLTIALTLCPQTSLRFLFCVSAPCLLFCSLPPVGTNSYPQSELHTKVNATSF